MQRIEITRRAGALAAGVATGAGNPRPSRLQEVVRMVRVELVHPTERAPGFDPYDSRLGCRSRDPWGRQRRG